MEEMDLYFLKYNDQSVSLPNTSLKIEWSTNIVLFPDFILHLYLFLE